MARITEKLYALFYCKIIILCRSFLKNVVRSYNDELKDVMCYGGISKKKGGRGYGSTYSYGFRFLGLVMESFGWKE